MDQLQFYHVRWFTLVHKMSTTVGNPASHNLLSEKLKLFLVLLYLSGSVLVPWIMDLKVVLWTHQSSGPKGGSLPTYLHRSQPPLHCCNRCVVHSSVVHRYENEMFSCLEKKVCCLKNDSAHCWDKVKNLLAHRHELFPALWDVSLLFCVICC